MQMAILREEYLSITDGWQSAVILNHFIFLLKRTRSFHAYLVELKSILPDENVLDADTTGISSGWFYKSARQLSQELMFGWSPSTTLKYVNKLVESNLVERRRNPNFNWDKTYQYRPNIPVIQSRLAEHGFVLDGFRLSSPAQTPTPTDTNTTNTKKQASQASPEKLLQVLLGGRARAADGAEDSYDAAERLIASTGWNIRPDSARQAAVHFFAALPDWSDDMPTSPSLRKKWAKAFREHAAEFGNDNLYNLYKQAWSELRHSGLSITWPGAMTTKMIDVRRKKRQERVKRASWLDDDIDPQEAALLGGDDNEIA